MDTATPQRTGASSAWLNDLAQQVGIRAEYLDRLPHAFSGGQRQRIAIAGRSLQIRTSSCWMSPPARWIFLSGADPQSSGCPAAAAKSDLRTDLAQRLGGPAYERPCGSDVSGADRGAGSGGPVLSQPRHPYTQLLLDSVPRTGEPLDEIWHYAKTDLPGNRHLPVGCYFRDRCPLAMGM